MLLQDAFIYSKKDYSLDGYFKYNILSERLCEEQEGEKNGWRRFRVHFKSS